MISIVIVNYNAGHRIIRCLDNLLSQSFSNFEVIVFDNASSDGSVAAIEHHPVRAQVLKCDQNVGFAAGCNRAASVAKGRWLGFLNPDAYPEPDWLAQLVLATERYPWAQAFGSTQIDDASGRIDGAGDVFHAFGVAYRGFFGRSADAVPPDGECFAACAAAALYRADVFQALGGFDERFFCYCEDVDLGFRLRLRGGYCIQVASAVVRHEGSGLTGRYSDFTVYHGNRNRIWATLQNMPTLLLLPMLPMQVAMNVYLLLRAWVGGRGTAYVRAMKDAFLALPLTMRRRRQVQRERTVGALMIGRAIVWSPFALRSRTGWVRPITSRHRATEFDLTVPVYRIKENRSVPDE